MKYPFSIEAEKSVLGSLMIDNETPSLVFEKLEIDDFYEPRNRDFFKVCYEIYKEGKIIDSVYIGSKNEKLINYIFELSTEIVSSANLEQNIEIIKEKSLLRRMLKITQNIQKNIIEEKMGFDELLSESEKEFFSLSKDVNGQGLVTTSKIKKQAIDRLDDVINGKIVGVNIGIKSVDEHFGGFQEGDLIGIAARPSMGKTALALNWADYIAESGPVAFFSLEMSSIQLFNRLVSARSGINAKRILKGDLKPFEIDSYLKTCQFVSPKLYIDETPNKRLSQIRSQCRRMSASIGLKSVFIDYLQLMDYESSVKDNDNVAIQGVSKGLKQMAKELKCPVFILSQLNRMVENRTDKRPVLSDFRSSGAIEQDVDVAIMLYREHVYNEAKSRYDAEILVRKFRAGEPKIIKASFIGEATKWKDYDETLNFS